MKQMHKKKKNNKIHMSTIKDYKIFLHFSFHFGLSTDFNKVK